MYVPDPTFSERGEGSRERKTDMVQDVYVWEVQRWCGDVDQVTTYLWYHSRMILAGF